MLATRMRQAAAGAVEVGFSVDYSADFDGSTGYLSDTFGAPTDNNVWTFWTWYKQDTTGANRGFIGGSDGSDANTSDYFWFTGSDAGQTVFGDGQAPPNGAVETTSATFTDTASWHYLCIVVDTDDATADNRIRIYHDGSLQAASGTSPNSGQALAGLNVNTNPFAVAARNRGGTIGQYFNGHFAYTGFLDGTADTGLPGYSGGSPAEYTGAAFGANGFLLEYKQTGANLGVDTSGNGNDLTVNGTVTRSVDVPT